jgi:hypothetical protein
MLNPTVRLVLCWLIISSGFIAVAADVRPWCFVIALAVSEFLRYRIHPRFPRTSQTRRTIVIIVAAAVAFVLHALSGFAENWPLWLDVLGWVVIGFVTGWFVYDDLRIHKHLTQKASSTRALQPQ